MHFGKIISILVGVWVLTHLVHVVQRLVQIGITTLTKIRMQTFAKTYGLGKNIIYVSLQSMQFLLPTISVIYFIPEWSFTRSGNISLYKEFYFHGQERTFYHS